MYHKRASILLFFLSVGFLLQTCTTGEVDKIELPEGKTARVVFLVGDVFIRSGPEEWIRAEVGNELAEGTSIKTEGNSYCEIVISSGTIFRMKDRSEIQLTLLPKDRNENQTLIQLVVGDLFAKAQKIAYKSSDTIATSTVTLGVRGTKFLVHVESEPERGEKTAVLVAKGSVNVKLNIKKSSNENIPTELKAIIKKIERGTTIREGFKVEVPEQKIDRVTRAIIDIARKTAVEESEILQLKQDALLVPLPLSANDKKKLNELEELSLEFTSGETFYISPNFDGANDEFEFSTAAFSDKRVEKWELIILDARSNLQKILKSRLMEEKSLIKLPEKITWNMVNERGNIVSDGSYVYEFRMHVKNGKKFSKVKGTIIVDTVPPILELKPEDTTFSPNGDGIKDTLSIEIEAEPDIEWAGTITTPEGIIVKTLEWGKDIPPVFEWDGSGENGTILPEGVYNITFTGQDRAGNKTIKEIKEITVDVRERTASVDIDNSIFSPNGDGLLDTVTFKPILSDRSRIDTWDLIIQTEKGETAKRFRGTGFIPETIVWDGMPQKGQADEFQLDELPSGTYLYFLKVIYRSGVNTYSFKKALTIDNDPPDVEVQVEPPIFSPDGDEKDDFLSIKPKIIDLTPITSWKAIVYTANDTEFKTFSGTTMPKDEINWDGISDTGQLVDSGEDYSLVFEATDSGFNTGESEKIPFSIDILVIPAERGLKIQLSNVEFGFNTAIIKGEKSLKILEKMVQILKKYEKYSIIIEGHTDKTGDENYNLILSKQRAEAVGEYLIQHGVDPNRLSYEGYGSQFPIDTNETPEGRARNRRVEFILIRK